MKKSDAISILIKKNEQLETEKCKLIHQIWEIESRQTKTVDQLKSLGVVSIAEYARLQNQTA